ncbi:MAG: nucleotide sugar dehydrogenase, partial [Chlamydiae bacterium]|nr:nucleotide sugar dehydrogenase [Chlamydiota bacterium]
MNNTVVIGLGYVGLTYALHIASLGYKVVGVEENPITRMKVKNGELPFFEKGLDIVLSDVLKRELFDIVSPEEFKLVSNHTRDKSFVFIITVGTPVKNKAVQYHAIEKVFSFLSENMSQYDSLALRSTVSPGLTRKLCENLPIKIKYCFAPERTIEGSALEELSTLPQVYGANDIESKLFFESYFNEFHSEVISVSNSEAAELVKLTSNVFRDVIFGFSNEIASIAFNYNVQSKEIIDACNYKYPRCNIPYSGPVAGPCLSKDSYILINDSGLNSIIINARKLNENYVLSILSKVLEDSHIASACILGLAFKGTPPTSDVRDSLAISIATYLKERKIVVYGFDPIIFPSDFDLIGA